MAIIGQWVPFPIKIANKLLFSTKFEVHPTAVFQTQKLFRGLCMSQDVAKNVTNFGFQNVRGP